jgi:hypothetical protein
MKPSPWALPAENEEVGMSADGIGQGPRQAVERSGFKGWLLQPSVLGVGGLLLLALGAGSAALLYNAPEPPDFAQLQRHDGVVAAVLPRRVERFEQGRYNTRRDGWILRLESGAEFFLGTPEAFDDASDLSYARTEAALPVGAPVTLHVDGNRAWDLVSGSAKLIDYAERCAAASRSNAGVTLLALVSILLGSLMCWSALKRFWNSLADEG